jgi:hypothetical protein
VGNGSVVTPFGHSLNFSKAIKVRGLNVILLSMSKLFEDGYIPVLRHNGGEIYKEGIQVGEVELKKEFIFLNRIKCKIDDSTGTTSGC